ncbi:5'-nucleotidase, lipoprotein e(P4) family [Serratia entomophila]|uniref:5'-nucleotidase, lipoprotein e(P4) family n=2 Tax=Serratia entomophila TaxID=42906 RepID=A0ABY5D0T1_9GAMM|nr:5'-nucleotidase, lipoprotein e(P4) family [Serratia entomophila]USV03234.1 5'-nucleotidase, lipoprotein e(P4) family [Serratia entomophila]
MAGQNRQKTPFGVAAGIALLALAGCAQPPKTDPLAQQRLADQSVLALNWFQQSGEYQALAHQAFNSAQRAFDAANVTPGRKKAVVVDLDETMLDNSPYSGWQALQAKPFAGETWAKWSQAEQAGAVPGAVQFARYVNGHQGTMFYVSNRKQSEYAATVANMQKLGFTGMSEKTVLLSSDTSNKQARFDAIKRAGYDIVVYAGDNLNDFGAATYHKDNAQRRAFVSQNQSKFGTEYILLPNPLYGDWESGMARDYNKLTPQQKLQIRQQAIKAWNGQGAR